MHSWEVPQVTRAVMRDLADRLGETVNLFVIRDIHRICVAHEESPHPLRHAVDVGDDQPLWAGASSKIPLRDAPQALQRRVALASPHGESMTPASSTSRAWSSTPLTCGLKKGANSQVRAPLTGVSRVPRCTSCRARTDCPGRRRLGHQHPRQRSTEAHGPGSPNEPRPHRGRHFQPQHLHADKAYDIPHLRKWLRGKRTGHCLKDAGRETEGPLPRCDAPGQRTFMAQL